MFGALLIFLLSGFPVVFSLVFRGINGDLWVEHVLTSLIDERAAGTEHRRAAGRAAGAIVRPARQ